MILDYMFTYGGPELLVLFTMFVISPVTYLLVLKRFLWQYRIAAIVGLWLMAIVAGFADVYRIGKEAKRLCSEEAGLHAYSAANINGLIGLFHVNDLARFGIEYVEFGVPGTKKLIRETVRGDRVIRQEIERFSGNYVFETKTDVLELPLTRVREVIRDIRTGAILGAIVSIHVYPGWLDRRLIGFLGLAWTPPMCDGKFPPRQGASSLMIRDLVGAVVARD